MRKHYTYQILGSAHHLYPTETHFGLFTLEDGTMAEIPQEFPFNGSWGEASFDNIPVRDKRPVPVLLEIVFLSIIESKFYGFSLPINAIEIRKLFEEMSQLTEENHLFKLIVGMAPYGNIALWVGNKDKQILIGWLKSDEISVSMEDFLPQKSELTVEDYCRLYFKNDMPVHNNLRLNKMPDSQLFNKYMQQFTYRYLPLFEQWDEHKKEWIRHENESTIKFDYVEERLFDGTHDKLHDGMLMNYHDAGKPKKLVVSWYIGKSEFMAYFWFEDEEICKVFDRFYGAHPETKTDFMIRIDAEQNKYELALYRYGLKEPQVISESAYQLLVFKNKFEYYRSENYNQPRGAWIW